MLTGRYVLERTQRLPRPRHEVFDFFAAAANLQSITPAFLHFGILTPLPIRMRPGALIDYRLRLFGVPLRWRTRIDTFEPPSRFTDVQLRGPYRYWHHLHEFVEVSGGTEMIDRVTYALPFGPFGRLVHALFVQHTLRRIFDYRRDRLQELFAPVDLPATCRTDTP
jgi:hypothetical protein